MRVNEGDRLGWVGLTDGKTKDILLVTAQGMAIRFKEDEVRPMGLVAAGVNGIKLDDNNEVVSMEILPAESEIFVLTSDGKAKRIDQKDFPVQGRYGKGVIVWDLPEKVKIAGTATDKPNHMAAIHLTKGAPKSTRLDAAGVRKRASTKGDVVVEVKPGEEVTSVAVAWMVEKFVEMEEEKPAKKRALASSANGRKSVSMKKASAKAKKTAPKKASKPAKKAKAKPMKKKK